VAENTRVLSAAMAAVVVEVKRAFTAIMLMREISVAAIEAARRDDDASAALLRWVCLGNVCSGA
jgi:hypothetical protein